MRLIKAELLKIRSTNTWWIFLIGAFVFTAAALAIWVLVANSAIDTAAHASNEPFIPPPPDSGSSPAEIDQLRRQWELEHDIKRTLITNAAQIFTSGQFFGLLFALTLGTLLMTNEFYHQTATATFLTTPERTRVILAKLATAMFAAAFFWVFTTAISLATGAIFFGAKGYDPQLTEWPVLRAILLNGLAFGLWGVLGVGLGVLIRSQIGAVITGAVAYIIGTFLVQNILFALYFLLNWKWVLDASVFWPGIASQVMISPEPPFEGSPAWWAGALVLVGYGIVFGVVGTLITRRRDIS
jgi:ABC-2 type transport system permease protein